MLAGIALTAGAALSSGCEAGPLEGCREAVLPKLAYIATRPMCSH